MGRDVQRDCSEIHLLVSLDTGQYKKEACEEEERRKGGKRYGCEYGYAETLLVRSYHIIQGPAAPCEHGWVDLFL